VENSEKLPGEEREAVLSYGLWQRRFGADPGVIGRSIQIDGEPWLVVGVMPEMFQFPQNDTQLWLPTRPRGPMAGRDVHYLKVIGRLKPGVSWQVAETEVQTIARNLSERFPETNTNYGAVVVPLRQEFVRKSRTSLWLLLAAALLVLLIACANVASMLVTRGIARSREIAVRSALGGSRRRVARQLLVEGLALSASGSVLGVFVAGAAMRFLAILIPPTLAGAVQPSLDLRLLGFAVIATLFTGVVFGLVPLRTAFNFDFGQYFRGPGATVEFRGRLRTALV
jgi:ABC-type antimicrobial peptide transport system permease subunit